ncbi:hypothetical protein [Microcoleus sp. B4-D4]
MANQKFLFLFIESNRDGASVPFIGYNFSQAIRKLVADVTLVNDERNKTT